MPAPPAESVVIVALSTDTVRRCQKTGTYSVKLDESPPVLSEKCEQCDFKVTSAPFDTRIAFSSDPVDEKSIRNFGIFRIFCYCIVDSGWRKRCSRCAASRCVASVRNCYCCCISIIIKVIVTIVPSDKAESGFISILS